MEALAPGTELRYLREPDSGGLMTLETEAGTLLSYEAYEADGQRGSTGVTWFGRVFLLLGAVFLIPLGQNFWRSRKYPKKKKK